MVLTPVVTLKGHKTHVQSISYFPDGKKMVSGCGDKIARQWDLQAGKEIEEKRKVCEYQVNAVAVSRDGRWVITAGGDYDDAELKACEVGTGITKTFHGHSQQITCIDISANGVLLASGAQDGTTRIWSLVTGKLVAGPFNGAVGAVRFSHDSKKLAVNSLTGEHLEVWDVRTHKLDARVVGKRPHWIDWEITYAPVLWANKGTRILAVIAHDADRVSSLNRIYEFDASTLKIIGMPFERHTSVICSLALSFEGALLASASYDDTIKLWALESRQLLASFHVQNPVCLIFSPDVPYQLAYTSGPEIYVSNTPSDILASIGTATKDHPTKTGATLQHSLDSDATRRPAPVCQIPATSPPASLPPRLPGPLPTSGPQQHSFLRHLREFLRFSSITDTLAPVPNKEFRDPLDFPAPSSQPRIHSPGRSGGDHHENRTLVPPPTGSSATASGSTSFITRLITWWPLHAAPPIADVPLAQGLLRNAAAGGGAQGNDEDLVPDEYFDDLPSPNPDSQQPTTAAQINHGEHGNVLCRCW